MSLTTETAWNQYRASRSIRLRNKLATENDGLVYKVAHRFARQCPEPLEDLAQIGRIGLLKAVERFDPDAGAAFSSFAVPYIQGELMHWARDKWQHLKVPRRAFEDAGSVKRVQKQMAKAGRVITLDESAEAVGISKHRWEWIAEATQRKQMASLDEVLELADESDDNEQRRCLHQRLLAAVATLPELQRRLVTEKFFQQLSDEAIAKIERLSLLQVQATIEMAILKLKTDLEEIYASC